MFVPLCSICTQLAVRLRSPFLNKIVHILVQMRSASGQYVVRFWSLSFWQVCSQLLVARASSKNLVSSGHSTLVNIYVLVVSSRPLTFWRVYTVCARWIRIQTELPFYRAIPFFTRFATGQFLLQLEDMKRFTRALVKSAAIWAFRCSGRRTVS